MTIAQTIMNQLGGNKFVMMTGANTFVDRGDGLVFKVGGGAKKRINRVAVTLNGSDLYDVVFYKGGVLNVKKVAEYSDIYADQLTDIFTKETGLYTSL